MAKRLISYDDRIEELPACMIEDNISKEDNIDLLKSKIYEYTNDMKFKRSKNMGEILKNALDFVKRNYENHHTSGL